MTEQSLKAIREILKDLRIGLNELLRWSFLGFLAIGLLMLLAFKETRQRIEILTPLGTLVVISILSVGLYAAHRSLMIWLHHLLGTLIFYMIQFRTRDEDLISPTRWLGRALQVRFGYRMLTYRILRNEFFADSQKRNVAHAVNGLIVMFFEGFLLAAILVCLYHPQPQKPAFILFVLAVISLVASYPMAWFQHSEECLLMKKDTEKIRRIVDEYQIPRKQNGNTSTE